MSTRDTPFGRIYFGGECKDDYPNIVIYDQPPKGGRPIKLQRSACRSFREAERRLGKLILLTGSWRSCAYQRELYELDDDRYAHPDVTLHTRGLAVDVSTAQSKRRLRKIRRHLTDLGWKQVRPDDEPWHYSYVLMA